MSHASDITRQAKSNLAFAFSILPKDRRRDAEIFYAFCRVADDLADDLEVPEETRESSLLEWKRGLEVGFESPDELQREVVDLRERLEVPNDLLTAVIDGCLLDLYPQRFADWEELSEYTWKVACAVGLVSMRVFGAKQQETEKYAVALGHALQITNILRDVGEDLDNDQRVYLPADGMAAVGYSEEDLLNRVHDGRFIEMMNAQADRAEGFYQQAKDLLPKEDREAMVAAEIMREIYHALLQKMRRDGFRVFDRRYSLSKARKMAIFSKHMVFRPQAG